ncbi:MAG: nucleoside triphosphate pyrophosphohydrolase [Hyphomicrobiaceae bacterium]|nr:nucleoside triphosphate pyrophosphohydrolase [Hyphomicrobiaceae bacterium]
MLVDNNGAKKTLSDLLAVMAGLRTPGTGCPWDLEQTFATIAPYTIEEAYEVADAIEHDDIAGLKDELGDLLLQVVYHARMAQEQDAFAFDDVVDAITTKMIRRHPHVFGTAEERAAGAAPGFWDRIKAQEKGDEASTGSLLDEVPTALPALTRAIKLQSKAAKVGFDWPSLSPVLAKLKEELAELEDAIAKSAAGSETSARAIDEEFGDLLFVVANLARHLKLDPEASLRAANQKFVRRFRYIEERLAADGRTPSDSDLAEMDALWNDAKAKEPGH